MITNEMAVAVLEDAEKIVSWNLDIAVCFLNEKGVDYIGWNDAKVVLYYFQNK